MSFLSIPLPRDDKVVYVPIDAIDHFPTNHSWRWSHESQNLIDVHTREIFPFHVAVHDAHEVFYRGAIHPRSVQKEIQTFLEKMRIHREIVV